MVYFSGAKSGDEFLDDLSAKLAELLVSATMKISQLVVVQAEEVEQGDVQVADGVDHFVEGVAVQRAYITLVDGDEKGVAVVLQARGKKPPG